MKGRKALTTIIGVGFMAALVFVGSMISIPIPTVLDVSRIHLSNIFCLLAGFMLGGLKGGLAAGLGSALYDLTNPKYIASAPITFINKFMMAFVCGCIAGGILRSYASTAKTDEKGKRTVRLIIAAAAGALTYVALYLSKGFIEDVFFLRTEVATALIDLQVKAVTSLFNAVIATVASVPLAVALKSGLRRAGLSRWLGAQN